ncbi:MAG: methyltransferase, partial [Caulobacteraceae bacterium]|nr:methyltransferase [Caulobacteraceae bacterium]
MKGREGVYGSPPLALALPSADAIQLSPLIPGADALEEVLSASLSRVVVLAPPGTLERRFVLAHALRALAPAGELLALALKDRGGARLCKELEAFGCEVRETARRHHRICLTHRPVEPIGLDAAIVAGALQWVPSLGSWSQPGVFAWNRIDPGSAHLIDAPPALTGRGADLGCGWGVL